jgi:hypothetical protein
LKGKGILPKITVQLTDDQHHRFVNAKMNLKEKSLQSLMIKATEAFHPPAEPVPTPGVKPHRHAEAITLLEFILDHGTPDQAQWITGNLKTFAEAVRPQKRKRTG